MPAPPMLADGGAWALEEMFGRPPDVVVSSAPYDVIANGQDQWWGPTQEFEGIAEDRWIKGYEFKPAYPNGLKVVHHGHASFRYGDGSGGFGGGVGIAHYGVGKRYETFPEGVGMLLPAGEAEVSWNIHYFPVGEVVENDVVDVGLWFYPEGERPEIETRGEVLYRVDRMNGMPRGGDILIPPYGEQVLQGIHVLSSPTLISSFRPHMHMRGKEMSMEAIYPDGRREMLGKVSDYRHIWQLSYQFEEDAKPLLPAGTMLLFTSVFDNSAENPLNPDPNQWVVFGRRGVDEMSHMWVGTTVLEQEEYDTMLARRQERHKNSRLRAAVANSLPPSLRRFKISFPARFHKWLPHCPWGKRCNPVCRGASRQLIPYFAVSQRPIAWSPDAGLRSHAPSRAWRAGVNPGPGAPQTMSALEPIAIANLRIAKSLYDLVQSEIAPGTGLDPDAVWTSLGLIVKELGPENRRLLYMRARHEKGLDAWHRERAGQPLDPVAYKKFLADAGYVLPEEGSLTITTDGVDPEISSIAGPQLVVPVDNARYALNAANARWGSLYDALYGTDVISEEDGAERGATYNPVRGARVVEWTERFLDDVVPLREGLYSEVTDFVVENYDGPSRLVCVLADDRRTAPADPSHFAGFQLEDGRVSSVLLCNHGLHIDIRIDRDHLVGKEHPAGVYDVVMESAITTIQDCEDSVSAVDAEDKTLVYRNWLGIMRGTLTTTFEKDGRALTRTLNEDLIYQDTSGKALRLSGRSLLLVRNVGIHMYTDAVTTAAGEPIPEGFLDALITSFCALHDLHGDGPIRNSRAGSIYIVKPKMHGPEEVGATVELFGRVEQALGMPKRTLKIGIMDEERRTTVNLKQCIRAAADRLIFINTGFLDRTGDEIHTSMAAGAMIPKPEIKSCAWMLAYEDWNVDVGIECGLPGVAQIGKGMWAAPDIMRAMVETKIGHPRAGANTAWVPSPTAATLHATHYHRVNVRDVQSELADRGRADLDAILALPLLGDRNLTEQEIQNELENNAQGILGYVVRWVGQGIGCSKVPDINDVALMEDRATLRISSQHIANWLHHGLVTADQVTSTFEAMAAVVDGQNQGDPHYRPMAPDLSSSPEFQAALELVFDGRKEPNGYTETVLHARRREVKARLMEQAQAAASEDQAAEGTQAAPETQGASEAQSAAQKAQPERETQGTQEARAR